MATRYITFRVMSTAKSVYSATAQRNPIITVAGNCPLLDEMRLVLPDAGYDQRSGVL